MLDVGIRLCCQRYLLLQKYQNMPFSSQQHSNQIIFDESQRYTTESTFPSKTINMIEITPHGMAHGINKWHTYLLISIHHTDRR